MAGIGLRLRQLFQQESYFSIVTGYFYSIVIATGPWLFSVIALAGLGAFSRSWLAVPDLYLFRVVIIYSFAFSLVLIGPCQLVFTRYLADLLYADRASELSPAVAGMLLLTLWLAFPVAATFYLFSPYSFLFKVTGTVLFVAICGIWVCMIFLEVLRDFASVLRGFFLCSLLSVLLAALLGRRWGIEGQLGGFTIGMVCLLLFMVFRAFREFGLPSGDLWRFLEAFRAHRTLVALGAVYNLGVWVDKMLYWVLPGGLHVGYLFYDHYPYDTAVFLAYLLAVPSLGYFLMAVETGFYERYRDFFGGVTRKRALVTLEHLRDNILGTLKAGAANLLQIQGLVTILALALAPLLMAKIMPDPLLLTCFRLATLAVFFHVLLLLSIIILMYFEFYRQALTAASIFLAANTACTTVAIFLLPGAPAAGYLAASAAATAVSLAYSRRLLKDLLPQTFLRQPVLQDKG